MSVDAPGVDKRHRDVSRTAANAADNYFRCGTRLIIDHNTRDSVYSAECVGVVFGLSFASAVELRLRVLSRRELHRLEIDCHLTIPTLSSDERNRHETLLQSRHLLNGTAY